MATQPTVTASTLRSLPLASFPTPAHTTRARFPQSSALTPSITSSGRRRSSRSTSALTCRACGAALQIALAMVLDGQRLEGLLASSWASWVPADPVVYRWRCRLWRITHALFTRALQISPVCRTDSSIFLGEECHDEEWQMPVHTRQRGGWLALCFEINQKSEPAIL